LKRTLRTLGHIGVFQVLQSTATKLGAYRSHRSESTGLQYPIDARPADAERLGDIRGADSPALSSRAPALTVPAGRDEAGLPIGVQIVGPRWSEIRLLEIAAELEESGILPGFAKPPGY